jgi:uncharacterized protein (TIGR00251 family)
VTADGRVLLRVRVTPRARTNTLALDGDGILRVRLTAPPVEGAANRALVELLADGLGLKRGAFEVVQGKRGRDKVVAVRECSEAEMAVRLRGVAGTDDVDKAKRRG